MTILNLFNIYVEAQPEIVCLQVNMGIRNASEVGNLVVERITEIIRNKGASVPSITTETVLLGGQLPIDSLDLATIVVQLEAETGADPFLNGFVEFTTVGELAHLFANAATSV